MRAMGQRSGRQPFDAAAPPFARFHAPFHSVPSAAAMAVVKRPATTSWVVIAILGATGAITPMSVDMTLPALPEFARAFGVPATQAQLSMSVFLFSYAFTQLVYGPLSDRFGRRPVLLISLLLFVLASGAQQMGRQLESVGGEHVVVGQSVDQQQRPAQVGSQWQQGTVIVGRGVDAGIAQVALGVGGVVQPPFRDRRARYCGVEDIWAS